MASFTPEHLAPASLPNTKSGWATVEEEQREREAAAEAQLRVIRSQWPGLMAKLAGGQRIHGGPGVCGTS